MRIESKRLTFWRAYWLFLAGMSLYLFGMLPVMYFSTGRLPWVVVEVVLLMQLFFFPLSVVMAGLITWAERNWRRHWEVTSTHVEIYRGGKLFTSLPWHEIIALTFRWGVMGLKIHRLVPCAFFLRGITQSQFEQVEAIRRASFRQGQGVTGV